MGKLDWNIGKIDGANDAIYTGPIKDFAKVISETGENIMSTVLPSTMAVTENTLQAVRSPIQTAGKGKNWMKLLKTLPVVGADVTMKALRLPFSTLDNAIQYVVNNNLERIVDITKKYTTSLVGNILSDNGNSRYKVLKGLGVGTEGIGDGLGTLIKAPTGGLGFLTGKIDEFLAKGTQSTDKWVQNLRVSEDTFIPRRHYDGVTNTSSLPEAANDPVQRVEKAA